MGQLIVGIAYRYLLISGANIAVSLFPVDQVTLSLAIVNSGISLATLLASIIPVNILQVPPSSAGQRNVTYNTTDDGWFYHNQRAFAVQDGVLLIASLILFIVFYALLKPPSPTKKDDMLESETTEGGFESFKNKFLHLCGTWKFFLTAILIVAVSSSTYVDLTLTSPGVGITCREIFISTSFYLQSCTRMAIEQYFPAPYWMLISAQWAEISIQQGCGSVPLA